MEDKDEKTEVRNRLSFSILSILQQASKGKEEDIDVETDDEDRSVESPEPNDDAQVVRVPAVQRPTPGLPHLTQYQPVQHDQGLLTSPWLYRPFPSSALTAYLPLQPSLMGHKFSKLLLDLSLLVKSFLYV